MAYWDAGSLGYRWNELATARGLAAGIGIRAHGMMALLNVAIYDATVSAWAAKHAYSRPRPATPIRR